MRSLLAGAIVFLFEVLAGELQSVPRRLWWVQMLSDFMTVDRKGVPNPTVLVRITKGLLEVVSKMVIFCQSQSTDLIRLARMPGKSGFEGLR